jgi:uncharacterized protein YidB (DUF937 family)
MKFALCITLIFIGITISVANPVSYGLPTALGRSQAVNRQACGDGYAAPILIKNNGATKPPARPTGFETHVDVIKSFEQVATGYGGTPLDVNVLVVYAPGFVFLKCRLQQGGTQNVDSLAGDASKQTAILIFVNDHLSDNESLRGKQFMVSLMDANGQPSSVSSWVQPLSSTALASIVSTDEVRSIVDELDKFAQVFLDSLVQVSEPGIVEATIGLSDETPSTVFSSKDRFDDLPRFTAFPVFKTSKLNPGMRLVLRAYQKYGDLTWQTTIPVNP